MTTLNAGVACLRGSLGAGTPLRTSLKFLAVKVADPIVATSVPVSVPTVGDIHMNPREFAGR